MKKCSFNIHALRIACLLVLIVCIGFTACSGRGAGNNTSTGERQLVIGFSQMAYTSLWRITETDDIRAMLDARGYRTIYTDAQNNTQKQVADVEDILAQRPDFLILAPREEQGLVPALEAAKRANVPVILIDRRAAGVPGVDYVTVISSDFIWEGYQAAEWIANRTGGRANIIEIYGTPGSTSAIDRAKGFAQALEKYPEMRLLGSQVGDNRRVDAQRAMENLLHAHGSAIDAVYTHSDEMTFGVVQAIKNAGLRPAEDILVVSIDGTKLGVEAIVAGEWNAAIQCNPRLGSYVMEVLDKLIAGEPVEPWVVVTDHIFDETNAAEWAPRL